MSWFCSAPVDRSRPRPCTEFIAWMAPGVYDAFAWGAPAWEGRATISFGDGDDRVIELRLAQN